MPPLDIGDRPVNAVYKSLSVTKLIVVPGVNGGEGAISVEVAVSPVLLLLKLGLVVFPLVLQSVVGGDSAIEDSDGAGAIATASVLTGIDLPAG